MTRIGITGSIASGKTSVGKIITFKKGPFFSADEAVKKLYNNLSLKNKISKKLKFRSSTNFKIELKKSVIKNPKKLKILEKIMHPLVRKKMFTFLKKNKNKKYVFCEIPLLIESKLTQYFDVIILVRSKKKVRLKRFLKKGGDFKLFNLLNSLQLKESKKTIYCDYIIVNNTSLSFLRKHSLNIMNNI